MKTEKKRQLLMISIIDTFFFVSIIVQQFAGQYLRFQITPTIAFHSFDLTLFLWILISFFLHFNEIKQTLLKIFSRIKKIEKIWLIWLLLVTAIGLIRYGFQINQALYIYRICSYILFAILISISNICLIRKNKQIIAKKIIIISYGAGHLLLGLAQYLFKPNTLFIGEYGWDYHYYRLIGTILDPSYTGIIIILTYIFLTSLKKAQKLQLVKNIYVLIAIAVALTFSRASYLAFGIVLITQIYFSLKNKQKIGKYIWLFLIMVISIALAPKPGGEGVNLQRTSTITARLTSSKNIIGELSGIDWIIGKGFYYTNPPNYLDKAFHASMPDNFFIMITKFFGITGLILTMTIMLKRWKSILKNNQTIFLALLAILIHSQFNNTLLQPYVFTLLMGGMAGWM